MEELEILGETPNDNIKEIELILENNNYKCEIKKEKDDHGDYLDISVYNNKIKYIGLIHIYDIQNQLGVLNNNIDDIFNSIYTFNNNKFNLIKDDGNKYKLEIEFIILTKKRYINIDLYDNINKNNEYIKETIKAIENKIKLLEEELNKYKIMNKDIIDNFINFIIRDKEPKKALKYHNGGILCSTVLKDGRFVTGSFDNSIIIYNNKTFKPDLMIKKHKDAITCLMQLNSGELVSCSEDKTIKIYNINKNEYKVMQTLKEHKNWVNKIIELKNKLLVSCSSDKSIIFYNKNNNEYKKDFSISTNGESGQIIQIKNNE